MPLPWRGFRWGSKVKLHSALLLFCAVVTLNIRCTAARKEDMSERVREAVQRATLDQQGTRPFHLKATIAPTFDRDKNSRRTGEIEIWWMSPSQWKREVRSPDFHQIEIFNNGREWQRNEGDYFPEWLRELAVALVKPVPPLDDVLQAVKTAEIRTWSVWWGKMIHIDWVTNTGTQEVHNIQRSDVSLDAKTGQLLGSGGFGWNGEFDNYEDFHGRMVARKVLGDGTYTVTQVSSTLTFDDAANNVHPVTPQVRWAGIGVTATVSVLEDLRSVPDDFFNPATKDWDSQLLHTVLLDEITFRKNLLGMKPAVWPRVKDGALQGNVTTVLVVDRQGKVRELCGIVSENGAVNEGGMQVITNMRFTPFLDKYGVRVQAMSQFTLPFKTSRH